MGGLLILLLILYTCIYFNIASRVNKVQQILRVEDDILNKKDKFEILASSAPGKTEDMKKVAAQKSLVDHLSADWEK